MRVLVIGGKPRSGAQRAGGAWSSGHGRCRPQGQR